MMGMYGFSSAAWLLNLGFGGNGGRTHSLFYQTSQLMQVGPLVAAWHAMKIQRSYLPNSEWYYNQAMDETNEWLYNPEETNEENFDYFDRTTYIEQLFAFYLLAAINLGVNAYSVGHIKADYLVHKAHHDAMDAAAENESEEEEEPVEQEQPAEEEEEPFF